MGKKQEKKRLREARRYVGQLEKKARKNRVRYLRHPEPDSLHDFRVAVRSLRAVLRLLRPVLGRSVADRRREELGRIAKATNAVRDLDIFEKLSKEAHHEINTQKDQTRVKVQKALEKARLPKTPLLFSVKKKNPSRKIRRSFRKEMKRARSLVDDAKFPTIEPDRAHQIRIRAKNLRYELEAFGPIFGHRRRRRKLRDEAEKTQSLLGDLHDVDVAIQRCRKSPRDLLPALSKRRKRLEKAARREIARFSLKLAALR